LSAFERRLVPVEDGNPTWFHSDRFLARNVAQPFARFLQIEASSGLLLLASAVVALVWANSPWSASYTELWSTEISVAVGSYSITEDLRHWVNDGLMTLFFFVVGLELKQELVTGHLSSTRRAVLPGIAALGGMVIPALIYLSVNAGGAGAQGWGIPMATDIAFAVGVLALLGDRVPTALKVLLLAIAAVDDIGAIIVIAAFYSESVSLSWLAAALVGTGVVVVLQRWGIRYMPVYVAIGIGVWLATLESGVHATVSGVALGLLAPARPLMSSREATEIAADISRDRDVTVHDVRHVSFRLRESLSVAERLQDVLHPWTSYLVVPVFALANAGVDLSGGALSDAATSAVTVGIVAGLVVGKVLGIVGGIALATRLRLATLPSGTRFPHVVGLAMLGGIGFTVSLFIAGLAFDSATQTSDAKIGILVASVLSAVAGLFTLSRVLRGRSRGNARPL
jgi:NhaA family Na+:H+ antiporter